MFAVIAVVWLPFGIYSVIKPLPVAVGLEVVVPFDTNTSIAGTIVAIEGDFVINRYSIIALVKQPVSGSTR